MSGRSHGSLIKFDNNDAFSTSTTRWRHSRVFLGKYVFCNPTSLPMFPRHFAEAPTAAVY